MAKYEDDNLNRTDFTAAKEYIDKHPEFALCRVRHDIRLHESPVDMEFTPDGGTVLTYVCHGCNSEYQRRYYADGRYHSSTWKYAEGYVAEKGSGYGLVSRSGRAAFNKVLIDISQSRMPKRRKR